MIGPTIELGLNIVPIFAGAYAVGQSLNYVGEVEVLREKADLGEELPHYSWSDLGRKLAERKVRKEYI